MSPVRLTGKLERLRRSPGGSSRASRVAPAPAAFPALMSNVAKLKKKAAELEQKKQFDKALAVYVELLGQLSGQEDDADVALYNRVGDLMIRQGDVAQAVEYY